MNNKEKTKASKMLSLVLRHKPEVINIKLDENGWTNISELLNNLKTKYINCSRQELDEIVKTNNKNRFIISDNKIRANQGHSVKVDVNLKETEPPTELFHGTVSKYLELIEKQGLKKMNRLHVHLSEDLETANNVGGRRGVPIILTIQSHKMFNDGYKFYLSKNNVWLTDNVPPKYINITELK